LRNWAERPSEVANLFNPAFCATVLGYAARGFAEERASGLPWLLAFVTLPLVLHKTTREVTPTTKRTKFHTWVERNPSIRLGFAERARSIVPHVREAIIFGITAGILVCDSKGGLFAGPAIPKKALASNSDEVRDCILRAKTLGSVLANAGADHTVLAMLGVQA
jgi:hypothetical protein